MVDKTVIRIAVLNAGAARISLGEAKNSGDLIKLRQQTALLLEAKVDVERPNEAETLISYLVSKYRDVDRTAETIIRENAVGTENWDNLTWCKMPVKLT